MRRSSDGVRLMRSPQTDDGRPEHPTSLLSKRNNWDDDRDRFYCKSAEVNQSSIWFWGMWRHQSLHLLLWKKRKTLQTSQTLNATKWIFDKPTSIDQHLCLIYIRMQWGLPIFKNHIELISQTLNSYQDVRRLAYLWPALIFTSNQNSKQNLDCALWEYHVLSWVDKRPLRFIMPVIQHIWTSNFL